jgi:colanic acid biosynthesis glycosyl transferase WcaI
LKLLRDPGLRASRVLSFSPSPLIVLLGRLALRRGGVQVAMVHDIQSGLAEGLGMVRRRWLASRIRDVERYALGRADRLVVLSSRMRSALHDIGLAADTTVLPLWVDTRRISPTASNGARPPVLLYSGNLGRKQGLESLLDVAGILLRERPEVSLVIQGEGSQEERLREITIRRGLSNVEFRPLVPPEQLDASLAGGDVHLVPQRPEGADFAVPSKVYAIMAASRPFVCTAEPGSTLWELMEQTGAFRCVAPRDERALADAVIELIDDSALRARMGARGRRYVETHVDREVIFDALLGILGPDLEGS